ncbi:hypothetical protein [Hydrogenimonas thermophila]|uniref:N-linked glycosylation glycosyltransferase PglG n=1 Tax=Hydrogenimonas thermophila TaxID=223786 RepID=A0A1I5SMS4_9BACT|nr:hypothetical protein [Hydrogenimonas thermophila]WOE71016.1 hypothetical protein RZR91_05445 [Hydrogenimonas thermophila]WOE73534.1 hypothetical protein RZR97_05425 [Hydrogenimonas thermophila]SFP71606.1 hypothetical protein SAMN05216234_1352 [Hydrogenimonas thermophila]
MYDIISAYEQHKEKIDSFIIQSFVANSPLSRFEESNYKKLFNVFPSLELIYIVNKDFIQISDNIYQNRSISKSKGRSRAYLMDRMRKLDETIKISSPYISSATGSICITVAKQEGENYIFMDFELGKLMGRLGLLDIHYQFSKITKTVYLISSTALGLFALLLVGYALISFINQIILESNYTLESIFKPIIAITLGLAVFDLAKTVIEQEVVFKSYTSSAKNENRMFKKFLISIIIALSIEAMMSVFKISLQDFTMMIHAFYLIAGIALMIISLAIYDKFSYKLN